MSQVYALTLEFEKVLVATTRPDLPLPDKSEIPQVDVSRLLAGFHAPSIPLTGAVIWIPRNARNSLSCEPVAFLFRAADVRQFRLRLYLIQSRGYTLEELQPHFSEEPYLLRVVKSYRSPSSILKSLGKGRLAQ